MRARILSTRRALPLLIAIVTGGASPARGEPLRSFLPWEAWLLGRAAMPAASELACPQPGLDGVWRFRLAGEHELLLRDRGPDRSQDYRRHSLTASAHGPWRGLELRVETGRPRSELRQRDLYSDSDALLADLEADFFRLGAAGRQGPWTLALALGRARGWEGALALSRRFGFGLARVGAGLERSRWTLDQSFSGKRYRFPFPFRREILHGSFDPVSRCLPACALLREVTAGEPGKSGEEDDWNQLYGLRHGFAASWPPTREAGEGTDARATGAVPLRVDLRVDFGYLALGMFADGSAYLRLPRLDFREQRLDLSLALPPFAGGGRALLGHRETRLGAEDGWFEPWPFSLWDIFVNSRYSLDGLHYRLRIWSAGYGRDLLARTGSWRAGFALRHLWLDGGGSVDWRERIPILPPFIFDWEAHHEELPLPARSALRLDLDLAAPLPGGWRLRAAVTQHAPLRSAGKDRAGGDDGEGPAPERFVFGGFAARVAVEGRLR